MNDLPFALTTLPPDHITISQLSRARFDLYGEAVLVRGKTERSFVRAEK